MFGRRKQMNGDAAVLNPPFGSNPNLDYGQLDKRTFPTIFPSFGWVWGGTQLSNGWQTTNMGRRDGSAAASYMANLSMRMPGMTRQNGQQIADFAMVGMSPVTQGVLAQQTAGMTPQYTGGVGTVSGQIVNPGSGG